jgi:thioredoxin reductase (NADPH)
MPCVLSTPGNATDGFETIHPIALFSLETGGNAGNGVLRLKLANNEYASVRSIVIATGTRYRRLASKELSPSRGRVCIIGRRRSKRSCVQAKRWLWWARRIPPCRQPCTWREMMVRGAHLGASMSRYLVDRIAGLPNVGADANQRYRT